MNLLTKRIPTLVGLLLIVAGIVGAFYYFQVKKESVTADKVPSKVRITNIADNKFSVSWVTSSPTTGEVEFAPVGEKFTNRKRDDRDVTGAGLYQTHQVTIEALQPSTQYAFRILSNNGVTRFDNNGSPYLTSTGPVIGATPTSQNFYGNVINNAKQGASGALVYLTLPGGATASTLVNESGNYAFTLSTMRTSDLRSYIKFDPSASISNITIESGKEQSVASVSLANSAPVPPITLGQNVDFLNKAEAPAVAEVGQTATGSATPEIPAVFNVEPLSEPDINAVTTGSVVILNPKTNGEVLSTLRPEFRGTGPASTTISIALTGQKAISDTATIAKDGTWSWAPVIDLKAGKQKISVSYVASGGTTQKVEREFSATASTTSLDPAFVSSPSASTTTAQSSSKPATASATPRSATVSTESGVPVTGVIENTLLTAGLGIVIMIVGAVLLAL